MKHKDFQFSLNLRLPWPDGQKTDGTSVSHILNRNSWLPTRGNVLFTLLMIALLLWAQTAGALPLGRFALAPSAPSTSTIAYQGRLADADGNPLTDTVNMIFRLYAQEVGSAPLWEEQWTGSNGVRVSDGLFNVMLGSLDAIPQSVISGNDTLWLGITVGTDDEMAPRVQLGTVPFAVQALTVPDGSVTTEKIANGAVTSEKQSVTTFTVIDRPYVVGSGAEPFLVSRFELTDVPPGNVLLVCSFVALLPDGANGQGTVFLKSGATTIGEVPTHLMTPTWDEYVIHGILGNFAGGQLVLDITADGELDAFGIRFGANTNDGRFGRKCTIAAGI